MANLIRRNRIKPGKVVSQEGPDWAGHRFRLRPLDMRDVDWKHFPWFYLGPHDPFVAPEDSETRHNVEYGFEVWWEGRVAPEAEWEFVEVQTKEPRLVLTMPGRN